MVAAARRWLGVPFRHQGRSRLGVDCVGLVVRALEEAGLPVADDTAYGRRPDWRRLIGTARAQGFVAVAREDLRAGVIALFRGPDWAHLGIVSGPGRVVHALGTATGGRVVEHRLDGQTWVPRLVAAWRHPGMAWEG